MRAKAIQPRWPAIALTLGLALGALISATQVRAESADAQTAATSQTATNFVCQAQPGGWCDLRDWSGMDRWPTTLQSQLPNN